MLPYRTSSVPTSPTQQFGQLESEQHGLYVVLHTDDIHTVNVNEISTALRSLYLSTPSSTGSSTTTL